MVEFIGYIILGLIVAMAGAVVLVGAFIMLILLAAPFIALFAAISRK